jgi:DedD protein
VDESLKQKIVGALVVTAALIIFVPTIFDEPVLEQSLIKVDAPSMPGDLNVANFDVLDRRQRLEDALEHIEAVRATEQEVTSSVNSSPAEVKEEGAANEVASPLREAVASLVDNIKDVTGKSDKSDDMALIHVWTIQLASFIDKENAVKLRNVLREQHEKAYMKEYKSPGGHVFRVYVGPMLNKEDVSVALKRLKQAHDLQGMVVRYTPE